MPVSGRLEVLLLGKVDPDVDLTLIGDRRGNELWACHSIVQPVDWYIASNKEPTTRPHNCKWVGYRLRLAMDRQITAEFYRGARAVVRYVFDADWTGKCENRFRVLIGM